jgi:hypothetical protein
MTKTITRLFVGFVLAAAILILSTLSVRLINLGVREL